jgi:hypothetical protein
MYSTRLLIFLLYISVKMSVYITEKVDSVLMNVGQWSCVFYSPVNLPYRLEKKGLKPVKRNEVFFK